MMNIDTALERTAVLGASGKMGRGISLLLLQEIARTEAYSYGSTGTGRYQLVLVDNRTTSLAPLRRYLREQLTCYAEKQINALRNAYAADAILVSNAEIIHSFVEGALDNVSCSTELAAAASAYLVFEALPEDIPLKCSALKVLSTHAMQPQYYFSNTSSIPMILLNAQAALNGKIVGLHFYNPLPAQKLIEFVELQEQSNPLAIQYGKALVARFGKIAVFSQDLPGFIGNGYFVREIAFACHLAEKLKPICGWPGALYAVDRITREFLIRPMGIFQFIDYIGINMCTQIGTTIGSLLQDTEVITPRIAAMAAKGIKGGIDSDGYSQPGFFRYHHGIPEAIYDEQKDSYRSLEEEEFCIAISHLGPLPVGHYPWKEFSSKSDVGIESLLIDYFRNMATMPSFGAMLSIAYLSNCRMIAKALVESGVAASNEDVSTILMLGFHQLYSPLAEWIPSAIVRKTN